MTIIDLISGDALDSECVAAFATTAKGDGDDRSAYGYGQKLRDRSTFREIDAATIANAGDDLATWALYDDGWERAWYPVAISA